MAFTKETASVNGRKGGLATKARMLSKNPHYYSEIGTRSGMALLQSRGTEWFARIGSIRKGQGKHKQED